MADFINKTKTVPSYKVSEIVWQSFPVGYNIYFLPTPMLLSSGTIVQMDNRGGTVAIDTVRSDQHRYPDRNQYGLARLNETENWAFYFRLIVNSSVTVKQYVLNNKSYSSAGPYLLSASLKCTNSSSQIAYQNFVIMDGKFGFGKKIF